LNKYTTFLLIAFASATLICLNLPTTAGILYENPQDKKVGWGGADYESEVIIALNDSVYNTDTSQPTYWFDTLLDSYQLADNGYEATITLDIRRNTLTHILQSPTNLTGKLGTMNHIKYKGKPLTIDNLSRILQDVGNVPVKKMRGRILHQPKQMTVGNKYTFTLGLEQVTNSQRSAKLKLGRDSFTVTVNLYQDWLDNTDNYENIQFEALNTGYIMLDNAYVGGGSTAYENLAENYLEEDTHAHSYPSNVDKTYGTCTTIQTGQDGDYPANTYLLWDMSRIPSGATIDNATLYMWAEGINNQPTIHVKMIDNDSWEEGDACASTPTSIGVTWNNKPDNVAGIESPETHTITTTSQYYSWDITSILQAVVDNNENALSLQLYEESGVGDKRVVWLAEESIEPEESHIYIEYHTENNIYYNKSGEWESVVWDLHIYSVIENILIFTGEDVRREIDLTPYSTSPQPTGLAFAPYNNRYYYTDAYNDYIHQFDFNWNYGGSIVPDDTTLIRGLVYTNNYWYVLDDNEDEVDKYNTSWTYQSSYDISGQTHDPLDIEFYNNKFYILSSYIGSNYVYRYDNSFNYEGLHNLEEIGEIRSIHHDGNYWYAIWRENVYGSSGTEQCYIRRYDNNFNMVDNLKTISAYDINPTNVIIDNDDNYVFMGTGTDKIYVMSHDNSVDTVKYRIGVDTDNDETIDAEYGYYTVPENGVITDVSGLPDAYCYSIDFYLTTNDNEYSPRVSTYIIIADYSRTWVSAENWTDNFIVYRYAWEDVEDWSEGFKIGAVEPLAPLNTLIESVLVPLFLLFAPALGMMRRIGRMGFIGGLILGAIIVYLVYDFSIGFIIALFVAMLVLYLERED